MAKTRRSTVLPLLTLIFFSFNFNSLHANELELLLSFKSAIKDPFHFLSSWSTANYNSSSSSSYNLCSWTGIVCNNMSHIVSIDLSGKNFSGELSSDIFSLPFVETINLSNNKMTGRIPRDIFVTSSQSLHYLNLSNNNFTGPIPHGYPTNLESLDLSNNMLSGEIPGDIGSTLSLKVLDLGGNALRGGIPVSITNLTRLEILTLASNQLTGGIPLKITRMRSLKWIYFGYNNLSGEIPSEIGELSSLNHLDLVYNNLTGQIPYSLGNLSELQYLFLYQNKLSGPLPKSIFGLNKLVSLDLSDNNLSGEIPELVVGLESLEILHLFSNNFTGKIPKGLTSLSRLQVLQLWSNRFSGKIPENLGKQNNLTVLDLSTNNLTGRIPESLCDSGQLSKLILFSNSLDGEVPAGLGACKSLRRVRLQNNRLSGELPQGFTELPLVYFLDLSNNNLEGSISDDRKWNMPELQMLNLAKNRFSGDLPDSFGSKKLENLDLSENRFVGVIPHGLERFSELMNLNLHENKLTGQIPQELSSCKKLVKLDLSRNLFTGKIPSSFSVFPVLGNLDLSFNQLSGEIPKDLGKVESLVQVNVSHNYLHGGLPQTGAFLAINATAVTGNHLCGGDPMSGLQPCKRVSKKIRNVWWFVVLPCVLVALLILSLAGIVINLLVKRKNSVPVLKTVESEFGTWEIQLFDLKLSKGLTINDVLSSVKEENVTSRGKKGVLYKGKSIKSNMEFVVRGLQRRDFSPEIMDLGKLSRHSNIIKLLATCRSEKVLYLIFEHVEGKRLSEILHGLSWERRRKISLGIAKALRFLHRRSFIAGELSPQRIIVDAKDEARLILGHPKVACMESQSLKSSTYVAPETRETKEMTEKSDIYGFGLLLIELLTGKSSGEAEFGPHENLVEWGRYCYSDCHLDTWVDPTVRTSSDYQNEIVETMNLALHCTARDPHARPCANDVCKTLGPTFGISSCNFSVKRFSPI